MVLGIAAGSAAAGRRVVELRLLRVRKDIAMLDLPVVNTWLVDVQASRLRRGCDRDSADEVIRQTLNGPVHRTHYHAVAVSVGEPLILPALRALRQAACVHLTGAEHHLAQPAAEQVPVDIDVVGSLPIDPLALE